MGRKKDKDIEEAVADVQDNAAPNGDDVQAQEITIEQLVSGLDELAKRVEALENLSGVGRGFYVANAAKKLLEGGIRRYIDSLPVSDEEKEAIWVDAYMLQENRKPKRSFKHALSLVK